MLREVTEARASATRITRHRPTSSPIPPPWQRFAEAQQQARPCRCSGCRRPIPSSTPTQNFLTLQSQLEGTENRIADRPPRL